MGLLDLHGRTEIGVAVVAADAGPRRRGARLLRAARLRPARGRGARRRGGACTARTTERGLDSGRDGTVERRAAVELRSIVAAGSSRQRRAAQDSSEVEEMTDPAKVRRHAERVRELVAEVVRTQIKDPRLGMITITDSRITAGPARGDRLLHRARRRRAEQTATAAALDSAKGLLRSTVGKALGLQALADADVRPRRRAGDRQAHRRPARGRPRVRREGARAGRRARATPATLSRTAWSSRR